MSEWITEERTVTCTREKIKLEENIVNFIQTVGSPKFPVDNAHGPSLGLLEGW